MGYAQATDPVVFHPDELLWVALRQARAAADIGHVPPARPQGIPVAGRTGIANFEMVLVNMREGGMISAHDYNVARSAARSEEHTSELQSLMRISYAVFCLKTNKIVKR